MTPKEKLLKRLPKKYHDRVEDLTEEYDLIDDCKYLLVCTEKYADAYGEENPSWPVRNIAEAIEFIKNSIHPVKE